ncbi:MAG: hypothetical protein HYY35_09430 [Deltaproteobacteria bacterium]|nr:hypothetical protein [Deltaproteobacteria bacterium]
MIRAGGRSSAWRQRRRTSPLYFCLVVLSCTAATSGRHPAPIAADARIPVESYFPLTERSQWSYRVQDFVKQLTYQARVRVYGEQYVEALNRYGIAVEERYSSFGPAGPYVLEEQEPILYFRENGYLNRVLLTYQAGRVIAASGSGDTQFLPEILREGASWDSNTQAFRVGDLGFQVSFRHTASIERETIRVPAGAFDNCVRVDTHSTEGPNSGYGPGEELVFYYSDWYAPEVGLVLTRQWDDAQRQRERTRIELIGYAVTPAAPAGADSGTARD